MLQRKGYDRRIFYAWILLLIVTAALRVGILNEYPLTDKTEARYAEIARIMLVTGDWITPRLEPEVPFWGKPPLSFWLTAISLSVFGMNEFAARLPSFLLIVATGWLIFLLGSNRDSQLEGLIATTIFFTSGVVFISAGMVMTDPSLLFSVTLAMTAFWLAMKDKGKFWGYLFFLGLAIGLLAKGPLAFILVLTPLFIWVVWTQAWQKVWSNLPWFGGVLLLLGLSLPWYILAEIKTPGFLQYFIIGEHFYRFIDSGWQGDLYGGAHAHPRGSIWIYFLVAGLPWSLPAIKAVYLWLFKSTASFAADEWKVFVLVWAVMPLIFFSFTSNILPTYILPAIPAFSLILANQYQGNSSTAIHRAGWVLPIFIIILGILFSDRLNGRSQKQVVSDFSLLNSSHSRLTYLYSMPYSASFYSNGNAELIASIQKINTSLNNHEDRIYVIKRNKLPRIDISTLIRFKQVNEYPRWIMYRMKPEAGTIEPQARLKH